jgi:hypothetical protein
MPLWGRPEVIDHGLGDGLKPNVVRETIAGIPRRSARFFTVISSLEALRPTHAVVP